VESSAATDRQGTWAGVFARPAISWRTRENPQAGTCRLDDGSAAVKPHSRLLDARIAPDPDVDDQEVAHPTGLRACRLRFRRLKASRCLELIDRLIEGAASRPPWPRRPALLGQPAQVRGQVSAEPLAGLAREQRGQVVDGDDLQRRACWWGR
jgi:hypothetical protein